jgi:hypothetical protein
MIQPKNYADPIYSQQIANENLYIYKRLIAVYATCGCRSNHRLGLNEQYKLNNQRIKCLTKLNEQQRIQKDNLSLVKTLVNIKPDRALSRAHTEQSWANHLRHKRQKLINRQMIARQYH